MNIQSVFNDTGESIQQVVERILILLYKEIMVTKENEKFSA